MVWKLANEYKSAELAFILTKDSSFYLEHHEIIALIMKEEF